MSKIKLQNIISFSLPVFVHSVTVSLSNSGICNSSMSYDVVGSQQYSVIWNGDQIDRICSITFISRSSYGNLCISALYKIHDCSVIIKFLGEVQGNTFKKLSLCGNQSLDFCGDIYHDVTIKLDATDVRSAGGGGSFVILATLKSVPGDTTKRAKSTKTSGVGGVTTNANKENVSSSKSDGPKSNYLTIIIGVVAAAGVVVLIVVVAVVVIRKRKKGLVVV